VLTLWLTAMPQVPPPPMDELLAAARLKPPFLGEFFVQDRRQRLGFGSALDET